MHSRTALTQTLDRISLHLDYEDAMSEPAMPIEYYFDSIDEDFGGLA